MVVTIEITVGILEDVVTFNARSVVADKSKVTFLSPVFVCVLNLGKIVDIGQTTELIIVSIGCAGVLNQLAVPVFVPATVGVGTILCDDTRGICNGVATLSFVSSDSTDKHTRITVPVILIVCANVIVYVNNCGNVAIFKLNAAFAIGIILTENTAAGNVVSTPQSGDLVSLVNGNISENNRVVVISITQINILRIPTCATYDTTVTDVINAGIAVCNGNILKYCGLTVLRVSISGNNTSGGDLTVGGEVIYGKILDGTAINLAKETHTVAEILLGNCTVPVVVTLYFPSVLIEIGNRVAVTVESSLEGIETARNSFCSFICGLPFVCTLIIPISDGMEYDITNVSAFLITKVNISDKLYSLTIKGILNNFIGVGIFTVYSSRYLFHTTNDCAEGCKLVGVCDGKLDLGSIVPRVIEITLPRILGIRNESDLGEGRHSYGYVTGSGVIVELVVSVKLCHGINCGHRVAHAVLYVVEGVVTDIKACGHYYAEVDNYGNGVILCETLNVYVERTHNIVFAKSEVCITADLFGNNGADLVAGSLCTCKNGYTVLGYVRGYYAVFNCEVNYNVEILHCGEFETFIVIVSKRVLFVVELGCGELQGEAIANRLAHVLVACFLTHLERDCNDYFACIVLIAYFTSREKHAVCRDLTHDRLSKSSLGGHIRKCLSVGNVGLG